MADAELAVFGECAEVDADLVEWDYGAYERPGRTADIRAERPGWSLLKSAVARTGESLQR